MQKYERRWQALAAFNGFLALVFGAVGAHAVTDTHTATLVEKASFYQLIHAVLLLWLATQPGRCMRISRWMVFAGTLLFCGTLYLKALTGMETATRLAPLGGISFMMAWLMLLVFFVSQAEV